MKKKFIPFALAVFMASLSAPAFAGSLENLERERALTISYFMDSALSVEERHAKLDQQKRRLIDLERIALRDDSLRGQNNRTVRIAFENYDVTFMAHAASEADKTLVDHWLEQFNVSTDSLMAAQIGTR